MLAQVDGAVRETEVELQDVEDSEPSRVASNGAGSGLSMTKRKSSDFTRGWCTACRLEVTRLISWDLKAGALLFSIDQGNILIQRPLRVAVLMFASNVVTYYYTPHYRVSILVGILFTSATDPGGPFPLRCRGLSFSLFLNTCAAFCAFAVSFSTIARGLVSSILGFLTGYSFALTQFTVACKIALVVFIIHAGVLPVREDPLQIAATAIGSALYLVASLVPEMFQSLSGLREVLFKSWRGTGKAIKNTARMLLSKSDKPQEQSAVFQIMDMWTRSFYQTLEESNFLSHVLAARGKLASVGVKNDQIKRLCSLGASPIILSKAALMLTKSSQQDPTVLQFVKVVGDCCIHISLNLELPVTARLVNICNKKTSRLGEDLDAAKEKAKATLQQKGGYDATVYCSLVDLLDTEIRIALGALQDTNRKPYQCLHKVNEVDNPFPALRPSFDAPNDPDRMFFYFGIRFGIIIGLVTVPSLFTYANPVFNKNLYWLPLTVTWVMGPERVTAVTKQWERWCGTLAGVGLGAALMSLVVLADANVYFVSLLIGITGFFSIFLLFANYMLSTMFLTVFVFLIADTTKVKIGAIALWRFVWTMCSIIIVRIGASICPPPFPDNIAPKLANQAKALYKYTEQVRQLESIDPQNRPNDYLFLPAATARLDALAAINKAHILGGTNRFSIDPILLAPALSADMHLAFSVPSLIELAKGKADQCFTHLADLEELERLIRRLENPQAQFIGKQKQNTSFVQLFKAPSSKSRSWDAAEENLFSLALEHAHATLDARMENLQKPGNGR